MGHAIDANQHANNDLTLFTQALAQGWVGGLGVLQVVGITRRQLHRRRCSGGSGLGNGRSDWRWRRRRGNAGGRVRGRRRVCNSQWQLLLLDRRLGSFGNVFFLRRRAWRRWWQGLGFGRGRFDELRQHLGGHDQLRSAQQQAALQGPDKAEMQDHDRQGNHGIAAEARTRSSGKRRSGAGEGGSVHRRINRFSQGARTPQA